MLDFLFFMFLFFICLRFCDLFMLLYLCVSEKLNLIFMNILIFCVPFYCFVFLCESMKYIYMKRLEERLCVSVFVCILFNVCLCVCVSRFFFMNKFVFVFVYQCLYVCMYMCVFVCM